MTLTETKLLLCKALGLPVERVTHVEISFDAKGPIIIKATQLSKIEDGAMAEAAAALRTFTLTETTPDSLEHVVEPGETLSGLALRFSTTVGALCALNRIPDADVITAGQKLRVPRAAL